MRILIGIDDTDNKDSRGTGFLSRQLAKAIQENNLGTVNGITQHQLFVHPDIAYTSQNSSACLDVFSKKKENLEAFCADFLTNSLLMVLMHRKPKYTSKLIRLFSALRYQRSRGSSLMFLMIS